MSDHPSVLPSNATPLERAIEQVFAERFDGIPIDFAKLWSIEDCPIELLGYLAWALSVDIWDDDWPEGVKRSAIRESLRVHRIKGTRPAVERALQSFGADTAITEWWEAGGEHLDRWSFEIVVEKRADLELDDIAFVFPRHVLLRDAIRRVKPATRPFVFVMRRFEEYTAGAGSRSGVSRRSRLRPEMQLRGANPHSGIGGRTSTRRTSEMQPDLRIDGAKMGGAIVSRSCMRRTASIPPDHPDRSHLS